MSILVTGGAGFIGSHTVVDLLNAGKDVVMQVKVGDKVLCSKYAGSEFKIDGKEVTIMRQSDVLAIVE